MPSDVPSFAELIERAQRSAIHLEMRDTYTPNQPRFLEWKAGVREDPMDRSRWLPFHDIVEQATARGVRFRRARIVSEPITDYIRFEYDVTPSNVAAGEEVRWLPRLRASNIALPGNDFWVFDDRLVRFGHFAGDGEFLCHEMSDDPVTVKLCVSAFDVVWERAIPHQDYRPA